uniref:D(4) dopamine receptor-like isoform X1 n=1 Tax=Oncorhynchus gorbuscha TaxID=8017 RepID=UPI001EAEB478|nr:D(4) dopamine receptor-like isoform X1 [Oncorhynchus gorbuscha]XP_046183923.1 D(4) dopamine receptor-like isoform X1 [Oncorhynchus gorbuscha]
MVNVTTSPSSNATPEGLTEGGLVVLGQREEYDYNYFALVLGVPLILIIILGNILVCLSVLTERSLKTATNYFIISLSVADLLLAVLVLPLYVYSEFLGGIWTLSTHICDALMTMDVMLCTASILNLCAISVDRYIAVVVPLKYNRNQFSLRQLVLITATWVLSLGVASPVIFGLNQVPSRDPTVCKLENDSFVVYSSVCSFFVPCPVMLFLYYWMFRGLRRWSSGRRRSQLTRGGKQGLSLRLSSALQRENAGVRAGAKEKVVYLMPSGLSPMSPSSVSMASPTATPGVEDKQQDGVGAGMAESDPMTTQIESVSDADPTEKLPRQGRSRKENGLAHAKATKRGRRNSKSSRVSGRERKAMKVLPVVVGRCVPSLLDTFLCGTCDQRAVRVLQNQPYSDLRGNVAGLRQQCCQPHHLHCLQRRVPKCLSQTFLLSSMKA